MNDVRNWLEDFSRTLRGGDADALAQLFHADGFWRDANAFGWTIATHEGRHDVARFARQLGPIALTNIEADPAETEGFFAFHAPIGRVQGHLRLKSGRCRTLLTALDAIGGHPEAIGHNRRSGVVERDDGANWAEALAIEKAALGATSQPYVVIVGAGQAGLALGARLRALGVPALLIDKHPRVGDQWRSRYKSLTLHDPVWYDHMPYLQFPQNWPVYTPKDKMGDWLESYAEIMELAVWPRTELKSATYDEASATWRAVAEREGRLVELRPAHLVMAVGNAGFPRVPAITGADRFAGFQVHSSRHIGGSQLSGKNVAIIGANNSAHDIAADLVECGARPIMIQRSSTLVVRQKTLNDFLLKPYYSEAAVASGLSTEKADLLAMSVPFRLAEIMHRPIWDSIQEADRPFYDALRATGFALDFAEDGAGMSLKYNRSASGYYIDVGASRMIIDGRIRIKSGVDIEAIDEGGVRMADGTHLAVDGIIYATGFGAMEEWIGRLISPEVAARIGHCWGYGSGCKGDPGPWEGEIRNMWKPTAQQGLWIMGGNLQQVRIYSRFLAQQLKARFERIAVRVIPTDDKRDSPREPV